MEFKKWRAEVQIGRKLIQGIEERRKRNIEVQKLESNENINIKYLK